MGSPFELPPLAFLSLAAAACGGRDRSSDLVSIDTLESGTIVVRNAAEGLWGPGEAWRAVERVRIGSRDATDSLVLFGEVADLELDGLGRIYVLDRQAKQVRVFASTGGHVRTLGREGGGPGEFVNPIGMAWGPEGNLWVVDQRNARYTVFDTAGGLLDSYSRRIGGWSIPWGGGFDDAGRLYEPSYFQDPATRESRRAYIRHTVVGEVLATDTFPLPRYDASASNHRIELSGGYAVVRVPFAPQLTWRFDGSDGLWFGVNDDYRLVHRTLDGDTTRIVERRYQPVPVDDADREAARERFTRYSEQATNAVIARIPDVKPPFQSFVLDDRGYLWVLATSAAPAADSRAGVRFDVFDPDGRYLGPVAVAVRRYPPARVVGNRLVGVVEDELGTPYVVLYRIEGRPGA